LIDRALRKFQKITNHRPERIFFYRDGVGEKQVQVITEVEIEQILAALKACGFEKTALVYINVCKRVNTRLFAQGELENTYKNPIPGMVVNSRITENKMKEFYLVSFASR